MSNDPVLPRGDRDPDDVHTDAAETVPDVRDMEGALAMLRASIADVVAVLGSVPDCTRRAVEAHAMVEQLAEVRDDALRFLILTVGQGPKQTARETGIGIGTVTLACRRRPS